MTTTNSVTDKVMDLPKLSTPRRLRTQVVNVREDLEWGVQCCRNQLERMWGIGQMVVMDAVIAITTEAIETHPRRVTGPTQIES